MALVADETISSASGLAQTVIPGSAGNSHQPLAGRVQVIWHALLVCSFLVVGGAVGGGAIVPFDGPSGVATQGLPHEPARSHPQTDHGDGQRSEWAHLQGPEPTPFSRLGEVSSPEFDCTGQQPL